MAALDATAIGVSILRRDMNTASSIMFLLGIQGKLKVFWGWVWNYFGHDQPIRLIIGSYERQKKEDGLA